MGVETIAAVSAMRKPDRITFHQFLNKPALAHRPATKPMKKATGHQGSESGLNNPQIVLDSAPVNAPAQGPQMIPTSTVPIESRNTGSFKRTTICPIAMLMAIATGMSTHVMVVKSFLILSSMAFSFSLLGLTVTTPLRQECFTSFEPVSQSFLRTDL